MLLKFANVSCLQGGTAAEGRSVYCSWLAENSVGDANDEKKLKESEC